MEKVIVAVVTTVLTSLFGGEDHSHKVTKEEEKKSVKVQTVEVERSSEVQDVVNFKTEETGEQ